VLASLFVTGCSGIPLPADSGQQEPVATASILPVADSKEPPAVIQNLMTLADQQHFDNRVDDASVTLEWSMRLRPRYPEIWSRRAFISPPLGTQDHALPLAHPANH